MRRHIANFRGFLAIMGLIGLLAQGADARSWHKVTIAQLAAGYQLTHVEVSGRVTLVKHEADGDTHIRLSDGKQWIVVECIPEIPCAAPRVGQQIRVRGIARKDGQHGWYEVHPVENLTIEDGK